VYQLDGRPKLVSIDDFAGKSKRKGRKNPRERPVGSRTIFDDKIVTDQRGTPISVFDGAAHSLSEINRMKKDDCNLRVAISSRTDEPSWAYQCMKWLVAADGRSLEECFDDRDLIEISYSDKTRHFESLNRKTGIEFHQMVFFDNERWNIQSVSQLGVKCYHTPDGMTREIWEQCLSDFGMS